MTKLMFIVVLSVVSIHVLAVRDAPYASQEGRGIKALSNQDVEGYLNGKGMGYAKAAELNGFPGPRHVLDLSQELRLTHDQMNQTRAIFNAMNKEAVHLGVQLIEKERELDKKFADESIDERTLGDLVVDIGVLEGKIRRVHLNAHLEQRKLLNEHQVVRYAELRGYTSIGGGTDNHAH